MSQKNEKETEKVTNNEPNDNEKDSKTKEEVKKEKPYVPPPPYKPPIPYPQRLAKSKTEGQFKKFVELLKQLILRYPLQKLLHKFLPTPNSLKKSYPIKRNLRIMGQ